MLGKIIHHICSVIGYTPSEPPEVVEEKHFEKSYSDIKQCMDKVGGSCPIIDLLYRHGKNEVSLLEDSEEGAQLREFYFGEQAKDLEKFETIMTKQFDE